MKIVYWKGCPVKVHKEYPTGQLNIEVCYPGEISKTFTVEASETTPCYSEQPALKPWMVTTLQRLALAEKQNVIFNTDTKRQINSLRREKGVAHAKNLEDRFIQAAKEDEKNPFTEVGKMQQIIKALDEISLYYKNLVELPQNPVNQLVDEKVV